MEGTAYNSATVLHIQGDHQELVKLNINAAASSERVHVIDIQNVNNASLQPRYPSRHLLNNNSKQ